MGLKSKNINWSLLLLAGILLLVYLLTRQCDRIKNPVHQLVKIDTNIVTKTYIDTIPFYYDTVKTYVKYIDTVYIEIEKPDGTLVRSFTQDVTDSLIEGHIYTEIKNDSILGPMIYNQWLTYLPKFPKFIKQIDTVMITINKETITYTTPNSLLIYGGVNASNEYISFKMGAGFRYKGVDMLVNYDLINKATGASITVPIKLK